MGMLEALRTRVLAEPWLLLLVLALGSYFVLVHRPRAAAKQKKAEKDEEGKAEKAGVAKSRRGNRGRSIGPTLTGART